MRGYAELTLLATHLMRNSISLLVYKAKISLLAFCRRRFPQLIARSAIKGTLLFRVSLITKSEILPSRHYYQHSWKRLSLPKEAPLISCVMIKVQSRHWVELAIQCFLRQTYPNKELIIVARQTDPILEATIASFPNVYIYYPSLSSSMQTLDELQQLALEHTSGEYICQWQDDHLAHPLRLECQMTALQSLKAEVCFCVRLLLHVPQSKAFAISGYKAWENSLLGLKEKVMTYPGQYLGRESSLAVRLLHKCRVALLDRPHIYTAVVQDLKNYPVGYQDPNCLLPSEWFESKFYPAMLDLWLEQLPLRATNLPNMISPLVSGSHRCKDRETSLRQDAVSYPGKLIYLEPEAEAIAPNLFESQRYEIGLAISTYNRPHYTNLTLESLKASNLQNVVVCLVDDASQNPKSIELLKQFELVGIPVYKVFKSQNRGVGHSLKLAWDFLSPHCNYLCNLDSDTLVKPNWLLSLKELYEQYAAGHIGYDTIATGFHTSAHKLIYTTEPYRIKQTIGGVNMFFKAALYQACVREALVDIDWDYSVVERLYHWQPGTAYCVKQLHHRQPKIMHRVALICTNPSVVQHIGSEGSHGNLFTFDVAEDY